MCRFDKAQMLESSLECLPFYFDSFLSRVIFEKYISIKSIYKNDSLSFIQNRANDYIITLLFRYVRLLSV